MPAQFISTRAMPCAASAFASAALICSSSVTSAWRATPFTSAATFSAFSLFWSMTPILAPLAAMARAVAAPRPEPPPVMRTATSCNCIFENLSLGVSSLDLELKSMTRSSGGRSTFLLGLQHAAANQRFHMLDVFAADVVGDRTDAGRARHRMAAEKQVIAGADQAGVEQHRIDGAELAGLDAFGKQPAMEFQQRRDEELRHFVGGCRAALVQKVMNQPVHIRELMIGPDDAADMQAQLRGRRDRLADQVLQLRHLGRGIALQKRQQQPVFITEMVFHQRGVDARLLRDVGQRYLDGGALDHQLARRDKQLLGGAVFAALKPAWYAGIQLISHPCLTPEIRAAHKRMPRLH